ncbi:hypothetical protein QZH41_011489 [Actinostola sp. cb2023]|nr:hypothetical protein QZH41_011489 [Actinostola sp. cb2023]
MTYRMVYPLAVNFLMSVATFLLSLKIIPRIKGLFLAAGMAGKDLNKRDNDELIPEGLGAVSGAMYLMCLFLFIPMPFLSIWFEKGDYDFPHHEILGSCGAFIIRYQLVRLFYDVEEHHMK